MKKIILSTVIFALMVSCNKEVKSSENSKKNSGDSVVNTESKDVSKAITPFKAIEFSPEQASKILGKQNNDTLYVTNFFATWCGPCMREIPHFKEKMEELKEKPVKFTFVGLDPKEDWETKVKAFAEENNLSKHIVLVDGEKLSPEFFSANFKKWDGGSIPFTLLKKGDQSDETVGMMSKEMLTEKINAFK